ncbi:MAG: ssDNA-binding domain-containing protein [Candidatus Hydrogenedentes bacterium]|nr:ssDNA-binding domain-containing protein [Candidatus Hydrogenedentota bacterium]
MKRKDIYEIITEKILALIDAGVNPWHQAWKSGPRRAPQNLLSRRPYRGINVLLLGCSPYGSPYWLTYRQATAIGGNVRKGEKSSIAVFWKLLNGKPDPADPERKVQIPILRYYPVFNVEQCEHVDYPKPDLPTFAHDPIAEAEKLVAGMPRPPTVSHAVEDRAFYRLATDTVNVPPLQRFELAEEYYSTLFHELTHSTRHPSRLNRKAPEHDDDGTTGFGTKNYGREELVAEMGSAFLCGLAGIADSTLANSAAYLDGWRKVIKEDTRLVVMAAAAAQKAVDYITNAEPAELATEQSAAA